MASHIRQITTPTADTAGTTVQLHHDEIGTYLFGNVSEGTQRAMIQRKFMPGKIRRIFLTGVVDWHSIGGLLGLILTVADVRSMSIETADVNTAKGKRTIEKHFSDLVIHGGPNLTYALACARGFIFRKGLPLRLEEARSDIRLRDPESAEPDFQDTVVKVWSVPLCVDDPFDAQKSGRKRSHEEMDDGIQPEKEKEQSEADRAMIDEAFKGMFDPDWSMDKLEQQPLKLVPPDAKVFVRNSDGEIEPYAGARADIQLYYRNADGEMVPYNKVESDSYEMERLKEKHVFVRKPWPGAQIRTLPPTSPSRQSMCYIVRNHDRRGKFIAAEAVRLGVATTDRAKLSRGEAVVAADGNLVTPDMVMEPAIGGSGFAIIDIPDESFIPAFLARPEWGNKEIFKNIEKITWNLGPGVVDDLRLQEFMRSHRDVKHSVSAPELCANQLTLRSAAETAARLHSIDPERFAIPEFNNIPRQTPPLLTPDSQEKLFEPAVLGEALRLAPRVMELDEYLEPSVDLQAALAPLSAETISLAGKAQQTIREPEFLRKIEESESDIPNRDMEVIALGTGSALPSKHRNVSGNLIRIPGVGSYLFDCGENTLGSLRRLLGPEGAKEVVKDLRAIWISHAHADHHLGTTSFIRSWRDATQHMTPQPRLLLACSTSMANFFSEYKNVEDFGYDRLVLGISRGRENIENINQSDGSAIELAEFGLERIGVTKVNHCFDAVATVFEWPSTLKVAYSGDCRPSSEFAKLAEGAHLLIHESTFENDLGDEAVSKKHSTMSEALSIAKMMRARRVLLTHFSQRYPKFPVLAKNLYDFSSAGGVKDTAVVLMAFDLMRVKLGEFRQAAQFLPALESVFKEEIAAEVQELQPDSVNMQWAQRKKLTAGGNKGSKSKLSPGKGTTKKSRREKQQLGDSPLAQVVAGSKKPEATEEPKTASF